MVSASMSIADPRDWTHSGRPWWSAALRWVSPLMAMIACWPWTVRSWSTATTLFLWGSVLQERQALPGQRLVATVMSNPGFERAWQGRGGVPSDPGR